MATIDDLVAEALGRELPAPVSTTGLEATVREAVAASGRVVVALDDDPTGVQTVHDVAVLAQWQQDALHVELERRPSLFFVLTNSRSLPEEHAVRLNQEIGTNLIAASERAGIGFVLASRSDSTLRGHFPAETDALATALGGIDGVLIVPAFFEGGRVTAANVHFVREGDRVVVASETEYARDATFGYRARTLPEWITEKTRGRTRASDVATLSLEEIREGGPDWIAARLRDVQRGQPVVVNALDYPDLWTVVLGLLAAEAEGKRFLYRTAASFVRARSGIGARPLLERVEVLGPDVESPARGVVIVGSHAHRSTEQLEHMLREPGVVGIEVSAPALLQRGERDREIARAQCVMNDAITRNMTPVVYTSRVVQRPEGIDELVVADLISKALVAIVQGIRTRPDFVVGKGGITSSDIGTRGLGVERAIVIGQVRAGVPVWRLGAESRFPGMPYLVFPGNVGGAETLAEIVRELTGRPVATEDQRGNRHNG